MEVMPDRTQGTRLYVWVVCASTLLLAALALHATTVKEFQSSATFQLRYAADLEIEKGQINDWVVAKLQEETSQASIERLLIELTNEIESSLLSVPQSERIRSALNVKSRPGSKPNTLDFMVSLNGSGTPDEVELVNALATRVASNLNTSHLRSKAKKTLEQVVDHFDQYQQSLFRDFDEQLQLSQSHLADFKSDLNSVVRRIQETRSNAYQDSMEPAIDLARYQEIEKLQAEKRQLLSDPNTTIFHPAVTQLQMKIETLQQESSTGNRPTASRSTADSGQVGRDARRITNRFLDEKRGDSEFQALDRVLNRTLNDLQTLDTGKPEFQWNLFQEVVDRHRSASPTLVTRMKEKALDHLTDDNPLTINDLTLTKRSKPLHGSPSLPRFLMLCLFSAAAATAVALNYQADSRLKPFRSLEHLQMKLGIPIVGVVKSRVKNHPEITQRARLAGNVVTLCEWVLLTVFVILILASAFNSEIIAALIRNPMEAVTRTFWMIYPQGT